MAHRPQATREGTRQRRKLPLVGPPYSGRYSQILLWSAKGTGMTGCRIKLPIPIPKRPSPAEVANIPVGAANRRFNLARAVSWTGRLLMT